jgi:hypothetical protein
MYVPPLHYPKIVYFHQYAAVMGMNEDLKLVGNNFTNAATSLYIATLITELATGRPSSSP